MEHKYYHIGRAAHSASFTVDRIELNLTIDEAAFLLFWQILLKCALSKKDVDWLMMLLGFSVLVSSLGNLSDHACITRALIKAGCLPHLRSVLLSLVIMESTI